MFKYKNMSGYTKKIISSSYISIEVIKAVLASLLAMFLCTVNVRNYHPFHKIQ